MTCFTSFGSCLECGNRSVSDMGHLAVGEVIERNHVLDPCVGSLTAQLQVLTESHLSLSVRSLRLELSPLRPLPLLLQPRHFSRCTHSPLLRAAKKRNHMTLSAFRQRQTSAGPAELNFDMARLAAASHQVLFWFARRF